MPSLLPRFFGLRSLPWISHRLRNVPEVLRVARGQRGMGGKDDSGDHGVTRVAGSALLLAGGFKFRRHLRCGMIKRGNAALNLFA